MSEETDLEGLDLTHRVVLIGVVERSERSDLPAHAGEIRVTCSDAIDRVEGAVVGTLTEAEVARALNELDAAGLVDGERENTSATGKGRPAFRLSVDGVAVLDELERDDRVARLVSRVRSDA